MLIPFRFVRMAFVAIVVMAAFVGYDHLFSGEAYLPEAAPHLDTHTVLRSVLALLLSLGLVDALRKDGLSLGTPIVPRLDLQFILVGIAITIFALWCAWLFSRDPQMFNTLSLEDGPMEWLSAAFLFVASLFFVVVAIGQMSGARAGGGRQAYLALTAAAFLALIFFVVGMEEISWMQRVFHVATPNALVGLNDQKEFNFHNISTGVSELVYYGGAFVLLVLVPFAGLFVRERLQSGPLQAFLPSLFVLVASAPMAAFNCGRWGVLPIQISAMMTVIILLVLANAALADGLWQEFLLFAGMAISIVAIQEVFLVESSRLVRVWDPTEYKELFISAGLALYAGQTWWRLHVRQTTLRAAHAWFPPHG